MNKPFTQLVLTASALIISQSKNLAQCTVQAFPSDTVTLICGDSIPNLYAFGNTGNYLLNNNFNNGTQGTGWQATSAATYTNPCGPSIDGTTYLWMGDATPQPRSLTTIPFDLTLGSNICFDLRYSIQGDPAPCEGPDEPTEGVYLQYSIDGGSTWVNINYFDPLGGYDTTLTNWHEYCFALPATAQTSSTQIRWFQDATSGAAYDHWGLDNIRISLNDPSYQFVWQHNGFVGQSPPTVFPTNDTTYTVLYTNGTDTCSASVVVKLVPPKLEVVASSDTTLCGKSCIQLKAIGKIIASPEQIKTFENNEFQPLAPLGAVTAININVQGLNSINIQPGSVKSVCLNVNNPAVPVFPVDISSLTARLKSPSGAILQLINTGNVTGNSLVQTCFDVAATNSITTGSNPYTNNFLPIGGSLNGFAGSTANGIWSLEVTYGGFASFGFFNSWNITFKDPEISYTPLYQWSPSLGLSDSSIFNPIACPEATTSYFVTIRDAYNCGSAKDTVIVSLPATGGLEASSTVQDVSAGATGDGSVTISPSGGQAPYLISADSGATFSTTSVFNNLPVGVYKYFIKDAANCEIMVNAEVKESVEVMIPNVIVPDGNGLNDFFIVKGLSKPNVKIFNRWGIKIYENDAYSNDWSGGKHTDGVYFYIVTSKSDGKIRTGTIHVF
jgi:hypothetical protein